MIVGVEPVAVYTSTDSFQQLDSIAESQDHPSAVHISAGSIPLHPCSYSHVCRSRRRHVRGRADPMARHYWSRASQRWAASPQSAPPVRWVGPTVTSKTKEHSHDILPALRERGPRPVAVLHGVRRAVYWIVASIESPLKLAGLIPCHAPSLKNSSVRV